MPPNVSGWWTDERVNEKVTIRYIHSHLRPNEAEFLTKSVFGDLSDDTYLDWILTRAKRFFLTLCDAGVPDQIFGIIDDSFDDDDLPVPEEDIPSLRLSPQPDPALERRFYKAQFKYLIRVVGDGEHIRYAKEETLPVVAVKSIITNSSKETLDRITLPSEPPRVFCRKTLNLDTRYSEEDILVEIADCRRLAHQHVLSIFGSYTAGNNLFVLLTPLSEYTLKSFLSDQPKSFSSLEKPLRKQILINWPQCLASGLAWLHANGQHHGSVRPSRIHVDDKFQIFLGQMDGDGILGSKTPKDDIEAYQYAAPEKWKRSVQIQSTGTSRVSLPSGGRTARKLTLERESSEWYHSSDGSENQRKMNLQKAVSAAYAFTPIAKGNTSRLRIGRTTATGISPSRDRKPERYRAHRNIPSRATIRGNDDDDIRPTTPSYVSSNSEENSGRVSRAQAMSPTFMAPPELRTAMVQTWTSVQHDMMAADVFSLGAIIMDILTILCKHSYSAFAKHRSSRNRVAGRGGGLADASFHANTGQVGVWAETLRKDSEKKVKKDGDNVARAIGPVLQLVMQCLEREPRQRMAAEELAGKLEEYIVDFARIARPHCTLDLSQADQESVIQQDISVTSKSSQPGRGGHQAQRSMGPLLRPGESFAGALPSLGFSGRAKRHSITIPSQNFDFDFDANSETAADDDQFMSVASYQPPSEDESRKITALPHRPARQAAEGVDDRTSKPRAPADMHLPPGNLAGNRTFWLQSNAHRGSYHFPPPPTQSPNRSLPPTPPSSDSSVKRPGRTTRTREGHRSSRLIDEHFDRETGERHIQTPR